jgi:hypothetical protein
MGDSKILDMCRELEWNATSGRSNELTFALKSPLLLPRLSCDKFQEPYYSTRQSFVR